MPSITYNNRRAVFIENDAVRLTVLPEGGHIAAIEHKKSGVNPLWTPPWTSIDPVTFDPARNPEFGNVDDSRLLAGIMGHSLSLDIFGNPSAEERAAGFSLHGEGSVVTFDIIEGKNELTMRAAMPLAQIQFERKIELHGAKIRIHESATSLAAFDRPIGWTQHATLGPPFLECGKTQFRASATKSQVFEGEFGAAAYLVAGAEFEWPLCPRKDRAYMDLRVMNIAPVSSAFTTHAMDEEKEDAFFTAWSPTSGIGFGYVWKRKDFPWLAIWEENHSRTASPWNGKALTRGMEFGAGPYPESRRAAVDRGKLFGIPAFRWLPAKTTVELEYWAVIQESAEPVEDLPWPEVI